MFFIKFKNQIQVQLVVWDIQKSQGLMNKHFLCITFRKTNILIWPSHFSFSFWQRSRSHATFDFDQWSVVKLENALNNSFACLLDVHIFVYMKQKRPFLFLSKLKSLKNWKRVKWSIVSRCLIRLFEIRVNVTGCD